MLHGHWLGVKVREATWWPSAETQSKSLSGQSKAMVRMLNAEGSVCKFGDLQHFAFLPAEDDFVHMFAVMHHKGYILVLFCFFFFSWKEIWTMEKNWQQKSATLQYPSAQFQSLRFSAWTANGDYSSVQLSCMPGPYLHSFGLYCSDSEMLFWH